MARQHRVVVSSTAEMSDDVVPSRFAALPLSIGRLEARARFQDAKFRHGRKFLPPKLIYTNTESKIDLQ